MNQPEEINNSSQLEITREIRSNSVWIRLTFDDRPLLAQSIYKDLDLVADFNREWESARAQYYASARDRTVIQSSTCEVTKCPICLESVDALKRSGVVLIITVYGHIICRPDLNEIIKNQCGMLDPIIKCPVCRLPLNKYGAFEVHNMYI